MILIFFPFPSQSEESSISFYTEAVNDATVTVPLIRERYWILKSSLVIL